MRKIFKKIKKGFRAVISRFRRIQPVKIFQWILMLVMALSLIATPLLALSVIL